jgi:thiamine biosynthesis lipoprotein
MTSVAEPRRAHGAVGPSRQTLVALAASIMLLAAVAAARLISQPADPVVELTGSTMGTTYSVKIDAEMAAVDQNRLRDLVERRLRGLNALMSTYDSASELSRFNRHASTAPYRVSPELIEVLALAHEIGERSDGAFDVTVAPLVDAWGFGPDGRPLVEPSESEIAGLRQHVGYERIAVDSSQGTVSKTTPGTVVDLSAIAKGYAVDRVASDLEELGHAAFMVEVGGEIHAHGTRRDGRPWRVGIERPYPGVRVVYRPVDLRDEAIATSGDYRNFFDLGGARYAHIIDPRSGRPIRYRGSLVSVVHESAATADAWATALAVLGPDAGFDMARREGLAALFVVHAGDSLESRPTPAFELRENRDAGGGRR